MDYKRSGRVYLSCMSVGGALCALSLLTRLWMIGIAAIGIVVYAVSNMTNTAVVLNVTPV